MSVVVCFLKPGLFLSSWTPPSSVGKDEARGQLDSALQDVNVRYAVLEETEKRAVCRALVEERARYCSFVSMLKPVLVSAALPPPTRFRTRQKRHPLHPMCAGP